MGNVEYTFIAITPRSTQALSCSARKALSISQIELNSVLKLNWIALNITALTFNMRTYAKLIVWNKTFFCMLNWIVSKGIVLEIETELFEIGHFLTFYFTYTKLNCLNMNLTIRTSLK